MNKATFLLTVLAQESKLNLFIPKSILFSLVFLLFSLLVINIQNIVSFAFADYSLSGRLSIFLSLFFGAFQTVSSLDLFFLIVVSLLFGINFELVLRKIKFLFRQKGIHITLGASTISLVASGCASCGLSLVSFIGLGGALALLPFGGIELYLLAIALLVFSLFYNLNSYVKACNMSPIVDNSRI